MSRYLHISPSPIGDRYSVASLRSAPFESSHPDQRRLRLSRHQKKRVRCSASLIFLSPIFARLLFICLTRLFEIVTLSSFAIPSDAHAAQYKRISPYPIGVRYSVVRQNLPLSLRFARPYESSHSDHCRAAHFGARKKEDVQARLPLARNLLLILNFSQVYLSDISYVYHAELKIIISVSSRRGHFVHERNYFG